MEDWQQRIKEEHAELEARLERLTEFLSEPAYSALPEIERSRLRNQARFMEGYAAILEERIAAF